MWVQFELLVAEGEFELPLLKETRKELCGQPNEFVLCILSSQELCGANSSPQFDVIL